MPADPPATRKFPASRRLKSGQDFAQTRAGGRRIVQGCLIANWMAVPNRRHSRLGVITSRKVGIAVVRTRSRRLLREAFRQHQELILQPVDLVLVARPSIAGKSQDAVNRDYLTALRKGGLMDKSSAVAKVPGQPAPPQP